jgi:hypothetical protein
VLASSIAGSATDSFGRACHADAIGGAGGSATPGSGPWVPGVASSASGAGVATTGSSGQATAAGWRLRGWACMQGS